MLTSSLRKFAARFQQSGVAAPNPVVTAFLMTLLLFVVANAYRNPPATLAQIGPSTAAAAANSAGLDKIFHKLMAQGNILLRFQGFDYSRTDQQQKAMFQYIRATYASFPQRVYVADAASPVPQGFSGDPFPDFSPSVTWEDAHQITALLVIQQTSDGSIRYVAYPRNKP